MTSEAFLITGANAGLGKDAERQLAMRDGVGTIILACRDEAKARAAQLDLQRISNKSVLETLISVADRPAP